MCFSATASFAACAVLTPLGFYTLSKSYNTDRRYLVIASFPLIFGIQQAVEGIEWIAIEQGSLSRTHGSALGYLFFAYFLWPFLVPFSAYFLEVKRARRRLFLLLSLIGGLYGLSLYFPLLLHEDWLGVQIVRGSILYEPTLLYDAILPRTALRIIYAAIVGLPLLLSSIASVRIFGILILLSVICGFVFFEYAFTSIWCFIAAILSIYVVWIVRQTPNTSAS